MMSATLVVLEGSDKGEKYVIRGPECSLGREPENEIHIPDLSVSRRHCVFRYEPPASYVLCDLGSRNGTLRNGVPVSECVLTDGDEITIGSHRFLFLLGSENLNGHNLVDIEADEKAEQTVVRVRSDETLYMRIGDTSPDEWELPMRRDIALLLNLSTSLSSTGGLSDLARGLVEAVLRVTPAGKAAVGSLEHGEVEWVFTYPESGGWAVSQNLIVDAMRDRTAVLKQADIASGMSNAPVIVAPILAGGNAIGVLCLGAADERVLFERHHLSLAAAVGAIAGRAFADAVQYGRINADYRRLQNALVLEHDMVGNSAAIRDVYRTIGKVARTPSTCLITGESGTGKELAGRAIHRNSPRASQPYVAINCAALTESLLESELFGHEKGAFTGALMQKKGKLEVADAGTVFLDEVGEMPIGVQAKLLRVLQEREFERVGSTRPIRVDIRVVAATNRDLREAVSAGTFRHDLFYRLNVVTLHIPPLRERKEDITPLAEYFLKKHAAIMKRPVGGISPEARECLLAYNWPGNVRELENAIERALVIGTEEYVQPEDLPQEVMESGHSIEPTGAGFHSRVRQAKREMILDALRQTSLNYTDAARLLSLNPTYLHRLIRILDLKADISRLSPPG